MYDLPWGAGAIPAVTAVPDDLLFDDRRRRRSGRRFCRIDRAASVHRIQRISDRIGGYLSARLRRMAANRSAGSMDQPEFRRARASDGVVDRRIDCDSGHRDGRQTRRCSERAKFLRHPARDGARGRQRAVSRTATWPHAARNGISADRREEIGRPLTMARTAASRSRSTHRQAETTDRRGWSRHGYAGGVGTRGRYVPLLRNQSRCGADRAVLVFVPERFKSPDQSCFGRRDGCNWSGNSPPDNRGIST